MRDILIIGLIIAVVVILFKVMFGTPLVKRVMESFAGSMINSVTECPIGSTLYMYDGAVFCCSGKIKPEADMLSESCVPTYLRDKDDMTFCSLGPAQGGVENCLESNEKRFREEGKRVCPPSAPNYAKGPPGSATAAGRCCRGPTNANRTDCMNTAGSCEVTPAGKSILKSTSGQPGCQLLKLKEGEGKCPSSTSTSIWAGEQGFQELYFPMCSKLGGQNTCLTKPIIKKIKQLKITDIKEPEPMIEELRRWGWESFDQFIKWAGDFIEAIAGC